MSNPIYQAMGGQRVQPVPAVQEFQRFRNAFRGDPRAEVQRLLSTGQMTQAQFNELGQAAAQLLSR